MRIKMMLIMLTLFLLARANANDINIKVTNEVKSAIKAAKESQKEAASLGFEWRDTGQIIKNTESAVTAGKDKKAIKLANIIIDQIGSVRKQAALAKNAGPRF